MRSSSAGLARPVRTDCRSVLRISTARVILCSAVFRMSSSIARYAHCRHSPVSRRQSAALLECWSEPRCIGNIRPEWQPGCSATEDRRRETVDVLGYEGANAAVAFNQPQQIALVGQVEDY